MISNNEALTTWLQKVVSSKIHDIIALPGDAGVRHFFRVKQGNQKSLMAIDSDPTQENNDEFIYIAKILKQHGLCVPDIYAYDKDKGFILESDLGDELIYHSFSVGDYASLNLCYENLIAFYQLDNDFVASRPRFDERFMLQELDIFKEWFLKQYLNYELSEQEEKSFNKETKS